jgi:hypothetical protein
MHADGRLGRAVEPIPFGGQKSEFRPKVTTEKLAAMYNGNGDLRFYRIFEWMLPKFGNVDDISFYEYMAARMQNYMLHIISSSDWKPKYFCPAKEKYITAEDVARFFGCQLARSLRGNPSIEWTWSTREALDAIGTCMECMPRCAFEDIIVVFTSMTVGMTMPASGTRSIRTKQCAVQMTRLIIAVNLPHWKTASTKGGRSA